MLSILSVGVLIGIGLGLRQLGYPMYYAAIIFFPFNCLKRIIYFLLFASKYSLSENRG